MKPYLCLILLLIGWCANAQKTTFILVRHAEKDTTLAGSAAMQADPPLNAQGKARAAQLVKTLKAYQLDAIFSTNYTRTLHTAGPIAAAQKLTTTIYNPKQLPAFADSLLQLKNQTILVVGHSNSTPALANLLLKENKYQALDESVYNKIFIITIEGDKKESSIIEYSL